MLKYRLYCPRFKLFFFFGCPPSLYMQEVCMKFNLNRSEYAWYNLVNVVNLVMLYMISDGFRVCLVFKGDNFKERQESVRMDKVSCVVGMAVFVLAVFYFVLIVVFWQSRVRPNSLKETLGLLADVVICSQGFNRPAGTTSNPRGSIDGAF